MYVALSGGTLLISVMSQLSNGTVQKFYFSCLFFYTYVRAEMNVLAFMNELDQEEYWYSRKIQNCKNLCTKSMESYPRVISHILAKFHPERATYTTFFSSIQFNLFPQIYKKCANMQNKVYIQSTKM